jgi:surface antigen
MMHPADPRWNHPPPLFGNAIDLVGVAAGERFQLDNHPTPGAMVVYGGAYGVFGHIGTVRAVQGDRYEVAEQNFLDFNPNLESHWRTFDLRSIAWPDPAVVGVRRGAGGSVRAEGSGAVRATTPLRRRHQPVDRSFAHGAHDQHRPP